MERPTAQQFDFQRESLNHAYKAKTFELKSKRGADKEIVYPNQKEAAVEVMTELFVNNKVVATLIALPQVGKTGTFLEIAYRACTHPDDSKIIEPRNVFIITGMSDRDWQKQTEADMLEAFKARVYHRGRLNTKDRENGFSNNLERARNALIILDECHVAAGKEHQVSSILADLGLLDLNTLRQRNIKLVEVSATPGATLRDTQAWGTDNHAMILLQESNKYIGFRDFIREGRLHPSLDLTTEEGRKKLFAFIKARFSTPRYHIIRLPAKSRTNGELEEAFKKKCLDQGEGWGEVLNHSALDRIDDLDHHMSTPPVSHRFILIKEFWRAGKRLNDAHVGVVHEPTTRAKDTNVTAQGLVGRLCGNDKRRGAGAPHMFCDLDRINEYLAWIAVKGDFSQVESYISRNMIIRNGQVRQAAPTFAHYTNVLNLPAEAAAFSATGPPVDPRKEVPYVFSITPAAMAQLRAASRDEKIKAIRDELLISGKDALYGLLGSYICKQVTTPGTDGSYKKHIEDVIKAFEAKKTFSIDFGDAKENCWQAFLDTRMNRVCILVWHGAKNTIVNSVPVAS
jgi:hypothetical protein